MTAGYGPGEDSRGPCRRVLNGLSIPSIPVLSIPLPLTVKLHGSRHIAARLIGLDLNNETGLNWMHQQMRIDAVHIASTCDEWLWVNYLMDSEVWEIDAGILHLLVHAFLLDLK